jgi:hypothetical protein
VSWLTDLADVYGRVLRRAIELTVKHWWLGLVAIAYLAAFAALAIVAAPFGLVGGFLLGFGMAALISSWLVLVNQVVRNGRVTIAEIPESFVVYLLDVITFLFFRSLLSWAASSAFGDASYAGIVADLAIFVFLNAAPEQIYLARNSGLAVFVESYRFIGTYWIEWLPINVLLVLLFQLVIEYVPVMSVAVVLAAILLAFGFIARGLLFLELTTSSRRAREFARRAAG